MKRSDWAECAVIAVAAALLWLPFAAKPVHIDDPMYLWAAKHIQSHPLDFYGFTVNWYGAVQPMADVNHNPPLVSFYLAAAAALFGWSEVALHLPLLLPAVAALLAIRSLARDLGASPLGAALTTLATPAFLVSSTTLMCDILMLSLWCGALALWVRGLATRSAAKLVGAALLAGLCPLAKYMGASVIPLLFAYAVCRERRIGRWAWALLLPLALLGAYQADLWLRYGVEPMSRAATYAVSSRGRMGGLADQLLIGLFFFGGCLLAPVCFAPFVWERRGLALGALASAGVVVVGIGVGTLGTYPLRAGGSVRWDVALQMALFLAVALHVFALVASDLWRRRDAGAVLLALWIGGTFAFASLLNWTTSARAVLPAAPAAAILCWRHLAARARPAARPGPAARPSLAEGGAAEGEPVGSRRLALLAALAPAAAVSVAVAWGDQRLASSARDAANAVADRFAPAPGGRLWFEGSWGFQYYMEERGGRRIALGTTELAPGDRLATPANNVSGLSWPANTVEELGVVELPVGSWVATFSRELGAGFYSSQWGPLPYVFGPVPSESYLVKAVRVPISLRLASPPEGDAH